MNLPRDGFEKAHIACEAFGCVPYYAIVVDEGEVIRAFVLSLKHLETINGADGEVGYWRMNNENLTRYANDPEIKGFELRVTVPSWWRSAP